MLVTFFLPYIAKYGPGYTCFIAKSEICDVTHLHVTQFRKESISICYIIFMTWEFHHWIALTYTKPKVTVKRNILLRIFNKICLKLGI